MGASVYVTRLASGLAKMGRLVEYVDPVRGKIAFISNNGDRVKIHARYVRGKLKITEVSTAA